MALAAFDFNVLALQRVAGSVVLFDSKQRRLPTVHSVALGAFTFLWPRLELAFVRVGFVAVHAIRKGQRLLEVAVQMAFSTTNSGVSAEKWILRFRVVKREALEKFFPASSGVAILAALRLE